MQDITNLPLDEALEKFINLKTAMNKSEHTIRYYQERFTWFCDFIAQKGIEFTSQINEEHITDYIISKRKKSPNLSDHTINNHLRAIRAVLYYFMDKGYTEPFHIPLIAAKEIPKEGYTKYELEKLIEKPDIKKCNFPQYRNWVVICHLLASGNRSRTIRFIRNCHVKLDERIIILDEVKNNEGYESLLTTCISQY